MTAMANKTNSTTMIVMALWTVLALQVCNGLCPTPLPRWTPRSTSSSLMASRSFGSGNSGDISRSRQRDRLPKTLYDYVGASPKDTQEQLKIRYTTLVRTLHPDSKPDRETQNSYYDLSEINAAWEVLKDPVERKKYDRTLQAQEIAEGFESLMTMGIQAFESTAVPWLQKTAYTTVAAVDASSKKAQEVNEQARSAYGVFELEKQSKAMDQKANADTARASKIKKELGSLPKTKISSLEKRQQQKQPLSSVEAQRIFRSFQMTTTTTKPPAALSNDMKIFIDTESKQRDALTTCQSTERSTQMASRKVEQALKAEEMTLQRLEDAQRAFEDAKKTYTTAQDAEKKARAEERVALQASTRTETTLERISDKVRIGLLQQQDLFLDRKSKELKKELQDCETSSKNYRDEAKLLRRKAKEIAKEE